LLRRARNDTERVVIARTLGLGARGGSNLPPALVDRCRLADHLVGGAVGGDGRLAAGLGVDAAAAADVLVDAMGQTARACRLRRSMMNR
jgi:hypothetical protein